MMKSISIAANSLGRIIAGLCLFSGVLVISFTSASETAFASNAAQTCTYGQLEVATTVDSGSGAAAGNEGLAFIIVNDGKTTCTLIGYPKLRVVPTSYKGKSVKAVDGGGMIFLNVKPRLVTIKPGATASFGVDYGDAYNQQDPSAGPCISDAFDFSFPVRNQPYVQYLGAIERVNFCYAGFKFSVTPIQTGPIPRHG